MVMCIMMIIDNADDGDVDYDHDDDYSCDDNWWWLIMINSYLVFRTEISPLLHQSNCLEAEMVHFIHQMQYYITFEVGILLFERMMLSSSTLDSFHLMMILEDILGITLILIMVCSLIIFSWFSRSLVSSYFYSFCCYSSRSF